MYIDKRTTERSKETGRKKKQKIRHKNRNNIKGTEETKNKRMIKMYKKAKKDKR